MEGQWIYWICAVIATLVLIALAVYIIKTLKVLIATLTHINQKIEPISNQTARLLENSNEIAESFQEKLSDIDPLMGSIANIGMALQNLTASFNKSHKEDEEEEREHHYKFYRDERNEERAGFVEDLVHLASLGVRTWQKIKTRR